MNGDYDIVYFKVKYHYENVPKILRTKIPKIYFKGRNEVAHIFNDVICEVNDLWDKTGKPAAFGDCIEDINPEYTKFVNDAINPIIARKVNRKRWFLKFRLGEYSDVEAYIPFIKGSRIWVDFYEI